MKKKIKLLTLILVFLLALSFIIIESLILASGRPTELQEPPDYLVILGAKLHSASLHRRLDTGLNYLLANPSTKVIVSGGTGQLDDISEAQYMESFLINQGIQPNRIILEDMSTNTLENLKFSLEIAKELKGSDHVSFLITTNKHHIFRSKFLGRRLGIEAYGLPADIPPTTKVKAYIREYFAVIKSFIFDW